jgi:hypothetical protein
MRMGLFDRWRRSRGTVMRKEYDDVIARMRKADDHALEAFYNNVDQTAGAAQRRLRPCIAQATRNDFERVPPSGYRDVEQWRLAGIARLGDHRIERRKRICARQRCGVGERRDQQDHFGCCALV